MFTFCPLQGALSESAASQSILELDGGVKVLIDVGWDESFDSEKLKELEKQVPTLSLVLLTHATVPHLAAFAHCCKHFPLFTRIPVYATTPVISLGRTLLQDLYASTPRAATTIPQSSLSEASYSFAQSSTSDSSLLLQAPTQDEIANYFALIHALKYSQPHQPLSSPFSPPLNGLTITAYNSGHTLGGTIWHIQHGLESIVYAVDWNQIRENVFAGAAWLGGPGGGGAEVIEQLRKPTALICSSKGGEKTATTGPRTKRDEHLMEQVKLCVSRGGTALIPVDSSARVLELAYLLEHEWRADVEKEGSILKSAKLFLAGRNMSSTMRYARSMFEWMDESIVREFEQVADGRRQNGRDANTKGKAGPFDFRHMRLLERRAQIEKAIGLKMDDGDPIPKVILASDSSINWGFSKQVFKSIVKDNRNLVILTEKPNLSAQSTPPLARILWTWYKERRDGASVDQSSYGDAIEQVYGGGRQLLVHEDKRVPLDHSELIVYQQWLATQRQLHSTLQTGGATALEVSAADVDDASSESSSSSDESETAQQGKALNVSATQASRKKVVLRDEDLGINILFKKRGVYDFKIVGRRGKDRMFPIQTRRTRMDDFGEMIRPEDFLRAEEREDDDGDSNRGGVKTEDGLGKKRKWDDVGATPSGKGGKRPALVRGLSTEAEEERDEIDDAEDEEEDELLGPSKLKIEDELHMVNLRIAFVDFEGLHDKRALHMLIPLIQPRKLILVGGNAEETLALQSECKKLLSAGSGEADSKGTDVFAPREMETVNASVDTNAWIVKLDDDLVKNLKWQKVGGLGIVTVTGQLLSQLQVGGSGNNGSSQNANSSESSEDDPNKRRKTEDSAVSTPVPTPATLSSIALVHARRNAPLPTLALPTEMTSVSRAAAAPLHVGELRLADLRRNLQNNNHIAEFKGEGTLVVDGTVAVRKTVTGKIEVESIGLPTDGGAGARSGGTFYAVRQMIYSSLAVVAGA
ncbi:putative cleavage and polyadenylylation specificity protein [Zalerion maritima]|uniref:Cleavage and polyadenylation specificity factor subunit 2 n=1 Tax=Zalerion maritima TaxID=339359 RepID=A0AAD5RKH4_9PEZI|nr:putative cleavage and polyadenylylation specificity protein [Zalerion maritima]